MKSKYDWFDENWNPNIDRITAILELSYRHPMKVAEVRIYRDGNMYPLCPRCKGVIEREYQSFCGICGQRIDWSGLDDAREIYIRRREPKEKDEKPG